VGEKEEKRVLRTSQKKKKKEKKKPPTQPTNDCWSVIVGLWFQTPLYKNKWVQSQKHWIWNPSSSLPTHTHTHTHTPTVQLWVFFFLTKEAKKTKWLGLLVCFGIVLCWVQRREKKLSNNPRISWPGFWFVLKLCNVESKWKVVQPIKGKVGNWSIWVI